ncbi:MAG: hypothetical protein A3B99_03480 [Candidatus Yanofskybacteria bacterium RIFCSPHIGHO2_02_FULL_44_12b]|uniref:Uncharacterized protein n=2 Tax=Candidatus Yanofskyibacteriota TaxID=1752733 RepID=A0A1F8GJU3_9BACT|nr:MAG: hypothetical protein UW79_C0031G0010 [Candidatus Yanofskybacteria bacterium GW2011_GWA2_44_9]OGN04217.1 MAG: hypothetical protein A2659_04010 [Candidatus Yanofskybacteria bacterium RIFCSPHIGHO2_01_FULL_44_24]OGN13919.1 MAG: hypothetical protein A3B99_03480 [Candidatus Yanofskybacteria bacterium RIFCSPHIGHO2_02_FULL_44_12b]OGN25603.1 MAG: hypothetical protein A2925_01760 [Candidatus Yanofskybacteria bacterium RIFCSPLOWO2_01_FULL_44_22]
MIVLQVLGIIYGIGIAFVITMFVFALAHLTAERSFSELLKLSRKIHLGLALMAISALSWPALIFKYSDFREIVIDVGRIALTAGYFCCAFTMFIYPLVLAWYIAALISWILLEKYHEKSLSLLSKARR